MNQEIRSYVMASRVGQGSGIQNETAYVRLPRPAEGATFWLTVTTASGTIRGFIQKGQKRPDLPIVHRTTTVGDAGLLGGITDEIVWADWVAFTSTTTAGRQYFGVARTSTSLAVNTTTGNMLTTAQAGGGPLGVYFRASVAIEGASPSFTYQITGDFEF